MGWNWNWVVGGLCLAMLMGCAEQRPAVVQDDGAVLVANKKALASGGGPKEALTNLVADAEKMLKRKPASVLDKGVAGPSGDLHDYVSYARYYWPNPKGMELEWKSIDGKSNERQIAKGDANRYKQTCWEVHTLGLTYWYTGNKKYAEQAAKLARVWFLDPATRMNPNFNFGQAIINGRPGRGIGLIEDRYLVGCLDGLTLLKGSGAWTVEDERGMRAWVAAFDEWLTTSKNGLEELHEANNHGSWYAVQSVGLSLYLGKTAEARAELEGIKRRIMRQIQPDGRQPLEIARADGYGYSVFNLVALSTLAELGRRNGVDLWHFELDDRTLGRAVDYMLPFAAGKERWEGKEFHRGGPGDMIGVVYAASRGLKDAKYEAWLASMKKAYMESYVRLTGTP